MQRTKRIVGFAISMIAAALLTYYVADGVLAAITCRAVTGTDPLTDPSSLVCPDTQGAKVAISVLAAIATFWFIYTGRLARLFRKV